MKENMNLGISQSFSSTPSQEVKQIGHLLVLWASSPSSGASGGASPVWASGQSPGHATSALNWSGVGHEKEAKPWLCMLRLSW